MKIEWVPSGRIWEDRRWVLHIDGVRVGRVCMWNDRTATDAIDEISRRELTFPSLKEAATWLVGELRELGET